MSKKYAFLLMGKDFDPQRDRACFSAGGVDSYIITVRSPEEAVKKARELADEALAHWRSAALLEKICPGNVPAADRRLTVSYVVCPKDQEEASLQFWSPGKA
ncbi:hypothetical protein DWY99_10035 [[Clostridium] leptum]|uniref:Uncharacterized protein n=1 Tax=[Clostridium] leptum TaxID=1535 RepID=A0A412AVV7_9FIRM|nr:hypothetical protein DWY99_10035 [[Clostridium] leptum]